MNLSWSLFRPCSLHHPVNTGSRRRRPENNNHSERTLSDGAAASVFPVRQPFGDKHSLKLLRWMKYVRRAGSMSCLQLFFSAHVQEGRYHFIDGSIVRTSCSTYCPSMSQVHLVLYL